MPDKHYVTVRAAVFKDGKLFVQKEFSKKRGVDVWDLPGGRIDIGEDIHTGLRREVKEEIGVDIDHISKNPIKAYSFQGGNDGVIALVYSAKFVSEDFRFDTPETQEVIDTAYMSKDEYKQTEPFGHHQYNLQLFDEIVPSSDL